MAGRSSDGWLPRGLTVVVVVVLAAVLVPAAAWASHRFSDVGDDNVHHDAIDWLADTGITKGCGDGTDFCAGRQLTRAEMASFFHRLAGADPSVAPIVNAATLDGHRAEDLLGTVGAPGPEGAPGPVGPIGPQGPPGPEPDDARQLPDGCAAGQIATVDVEGDPWVCGEDADTTYSAGTGLTLTGDTFAVNTTTVQRRVTGSCSGSQAISAVASDGSVSCTATGAGSILGPSVRQVGEGEEVILADRRGMQIVGTCVEGGPAEVVIRYTGTQVNVVSDSRTTVRGQTLSSGDLALGSAAFADRGDFNLSAATGGGVMNGSFYAVRLASVCQFNFSALAN